MTKTKNNNSSLNLAKKVQRQVAVKDGFYDGRFRQRAVPDKKKTENKNKARRKVHFENEQ